jgi:NAD(P)-dependent dehydrogenase (short-subunit alcohol dehydrogenase family)
MSESKTGKREQTALILGASRGLGLALVEEYLKRGWRVIATERGGEKSGLHDLLEKASGKLEIEQVDITRQDQIEALKARLLGKSFDLLFVNAGVSNKAEETVSQVSTEEFMRVMVTNALSPMRVIESYEGLVAPQGTVGAMSSELGSVSQNETGGWEVYRGSKAALNTFMRSFAARHSSDSRTFLIVAPGWVRTELGGSEAPLSIEESIPRVVDTITAQTGKRGLQYLNYQGLTVPW